MSSQADSEQASTTLVRKKTVRTDDGVNIAYTVRGEGPRTLLFMHGWGTASTGFLWNGVFAHLDLSGVRAICADYRGHGDSDEVEMGYTHERFARDMFAVADQEGVNNLVLVGFSMAGQFVQYMTYVAPRRVQGQILISPAAAAAYGAPHEILQGWCDAAPHPEQFREILLQFVRAPVRPEVIDQYCAAVTNTPRVALEGTMHMFNDLSIVEQVKQTRVPTLVIGATADPLMSPDYFRQGILALIPGSRLAPLKCGHEIPIEMPREAAGLIEAFLAGLETAR